jgi:hypothetical protein
MSTLEYLRENGKFPPEFFDEVMGMPGAWFDLVARIEAVGDIILRDQALDGPISSAGMPLRPALARAFEDSWPRKFTHAIDVLAGRALEVVRATLHTLKAAHDRSRTDAVPRDRARRAARLVSLLWPSVDEGSCDLYGRWWPLAASDGQETAGVVQEWLQWLEPEGLPRALDGLSPVLQLLAIIDRASSSSYQLLFPVAVPAHDLSGRILAVRVTLLDPAQTTRLPQLVLAPWSALLLQREREDWLTKLHKGLELLARSALPEWGQLFQQGHFMLELAPLSAPSRSEPREAVLQPPSFAINGDSLGLAVVLAARAAVRRRPLRRMIVTGAIGDGDVAAVGYIPAKFAAAKDFAALERFRSYPYLFLMPARDSHDLLEDWVRPVTTWQDLVDREDELLGDGFQAYRTAVAGARLEPLRVQESGGTSDARDTCLQEEVDQLDETAREVYSALVAGNNPTPPAPVCLPFDNDPAPVGLYLIQRLMARINACPDPAPADLPVPLLFPLGACPSIRLQNP